MNIVITETTVSCRVGFFYQFIIGIGVPGAGPALEPKMSSTGLAPWAGKKSSTIYGVIGHLER